MPSGFRFLDLPAELRNRVYEICVDEQFVTLVPASCDRKSSKSLSSNRKYFGLTQVARQIREEFHPSYCLRASIRVHAQHVEEFVPWFRSLRHFRMACARLEVEFYHPRWRASLAQIWHRSSHAIEVLSLLQLRAAAPQIEIYFVARADESQYQHEFHPLLLSASIGDLSRLLDSRGVAASTRLSAYAAITIKKEPLRYLYNVIEVTMGKDYVEKWMTKDINTRMSEYRYPITSWYCGDPRADDLTKCQCFIRSLGLTELDLMIVLIVGETQRG